jgi:hypothetical protein
MPAENTYSLSAFDHETGKQLFHWPVVKVEDIARPGINAIITDAEGQHWRVLRVRPGSTYGNWHVDVRSDPSRPL